MWAIRYKTWYQDGWGRDLQGDVIHPTIFTKHEDAEKAVKEIKKENGDARNFSIEYVDVN
jgi:hypothetical protein